MLRKYLVLLRVNWAGVLAYRASIFIYMLLGTAPLFSLAVWLSLSAGGPVADYSSNDFIAYYLAVILVQHLTGAWVTFELEYQIREGLLSPKLLKPLNPIHEHIAVHIADKLFRLPLLLPPVIVVALLVPGLPFAFSAQNVLLFTLSTILAFAIIFASAYCIGLLNFWITHASAVSELWFALRMLLGGTLAPLELFPAPIPALSVYLPFRYTLSFPVEIILGRVAADQLWLGFAVQGAWLLFFAGLYRLLWTRGLREYSAVGA